ncbi:Fur family transcriptional regulator, ferric uptake regulator [Desulfocicer vacuolatum DSM 3385]|uniref:Fur family transcriptional regulator, ferric uptake regulator n=1 Tax=Desulfocicer vacuolatum DSM 3385 TaxID=1121400 RepID=A0A1W1ZUW1_9BACT|nr:FeoA domain-containing protein [Desulfocicer vacuolatum]SMC52163.1 Fur family transcriptional regulator, ferric uptake regulator [Desulfocicer vacuolatum DSM 3385]
MNTRHEQEKKQFKQLFQEEGVDAFEKRFKILDCFLKTEKHVTCREIMDQLKIDGMPMDDDFVEETMALLCRFGFAHMVQFEDGPRRYEHRHLGMHHDHMVCVKCGDILEFKDEVLEKKQAHVAAAYGFHMLQHRMEIYGICSKCLKTRELMMPLCRARQGETCIIKSLGGGRRAQMRLASMGLRYGDTVEVVSSQGGGQMVVATGESRFAICHGLAEKILVQHAPREMDADASLPQGRCAGPGRLPGRKIALSHMKQGQEGVIVRVGGEGTLRRRLLEMGINRGTHIYVEKYAPLKDPLEIIVKGYHVSLRVEEADNIMVEDVKTVKHP